MSDLHQSIRRGGGITSIERWALRWRKGLGVCAALCLLSYFGLWMGLIGGEIQAEVLMWVGGFFVTQWGLLLPCAGWGFRLAETGRPIKRAIFFAALPSALLVVGLFWLMIEVVGGFDWPDHWPEEWAMFGPIVAMWGLWFAVFYTQWRDVDEYTWLAKVLRRLMAGSFVEVLLSVAVFAWNPQKEDCECARGSFWGILLGATVFVWSFGPGVVLLFMHERYRDEKRRRLIQKRRSGRAGK